MTRKGGGTAAGPPPQTPKQRLRRWLRGGVAFFVSGAGLAWFIHDVEWSEVGESLRNVGQGWVVLAALILCGEFAIRAARWQVLLRPLGATARYGDLFAATVIGAAANILLPLRAGEVAKPLVAARRTGHPLTAVIATAVMERVYDLLGMVTVLVLMVVVLPGDGGAEGELVSNLKLYGGMLGFVALSCMVVFFNLATRQVAARNIFARIVSIAPDPVASRFMELFDGFVAGLGNALDRTGLWQAGLLSVWLWFDGALAIYCLFQAFGFELPFGAACFVAVAIALAVVLPQAPGFIGVFHVAMEKTMVLWGQPIPDSKGFAIVFWAVSFLPVGVIGLIALWREGISLTALTHIDPPNIPPPKE